MSQGPNKDIPLPTDYANLVAWALANPDVIRDAIARQNRMANMRVQLAVPGANNRFPLTPLDSPEQMTLGLPLMFATTIANVTAGGTTDTNCRATLNALLAALRTTGQNPS